jgi:nucleotide-binding universal stress UspA family protein
MATIVVGYDGSRCSLAALRWAMAEATAHDKSMSVISVLEPRHVPSLWTASVIVPPPDRDLANAREHAEDAVAKVAADLGVTPRSEVSVLVGHAGPTLVRAASDAEMLVVGSHGHSAVQCMLLGSVSTFATHHARCPLALIRSSD